MKFPFFLLTFIVLAASAQASDFICSALTQTGRATNGELVPVQLAPNSKLTIHIDAARPTRSTITWSETGDPELDNQPSAFTTGSRVIQRDGQVFASMLADLKKLKSVGTLLIGRDGELWITESTSASGKIAHYIIQGRCEPKK